MILLCLALAAADPETCPQAAPWRSDATEADRQRLRDWRSAWTTALEEARTAGKPAAAEALFDPDRALDRPMPPAGTYRCRFVKLGKQGAATRDWGRCSVGEGAFAKHDGPQRPVGRLYADGEARAVFLGTLLLEDERRPLRYGRDRRRDLVGVVERIGEARWRIALPSPGFESTLDLIELERAP